MKNSNLEKRAGFGKSAILMVIAIAIYAAVMATISFMKLPKLGYVDSSVLLQKYPRAIEARENIKKKTEEWQKNVRTLETELSQLNQEILNKSADWNSTTRKLKQEAFAKKQNELIRYSRTVNEKAAKLEQELMLPVFNELNAYMKDFGKEHGFAMIFGTVAGGNILYAKQAIDLTEEILAYVSEKE